MHHATGALRGRAPSNAPGASLARARCSSAARARVCVVLCSKWREPGWVDLLEEEGRQVIGVDLLGHGKAEKPHDPDAYAALERDVAAALPASGLVDAIGFSLGARLLLGVAAAGPDRFRPGGGRRGGREPFPGRRPRALGAGDRGRGGPRGRPRVGAGVRPLRPGSRQRPGCPGRLFAPPDTTPRSPYPERRGLPGAGGPRRSGLRRRRPIVSLTPCRTPASLAPGYRSFRYPQGLPFPRSRPRVPPELSLAIVLLTCSAHGPWSSVNGALEARQDSSQEGARRTRSAPPRATHAVAA